MRCRVLTAKNIAKNLARLLTPCASMNAPITDAFVCSSQKPLCFGVPQSSSLLQSRGQILQFLKGDKGNLRAINSSTAFSL